MDNTHQLKNKEIAALKKSHGLKELIQSERQILFDESGIDPDTSKLWKRSIRTM